MSILDKKPYIFGVRHLSPGASFHLLRFLDEIKPTAVLIEGLSDANDQIAHFSSINTRPPFAILAYTEELPVKTVLYPFADYSPEYQALMWARENQAHAEFIDLPSDVFIKLDYDVRKGDLDDKIGNRSDIYQKWAELSGEEDHDSYWEYHFEHNLSKDSYRMAAYEFGRSLRELSQDDKYEQAKNLIREAYMRNKIRKVIASGHKEDKIVVVTGAYHASVLGPDYEPMSDDEIEKLPRIKTKLTLMPYSFYRLSAKSGYGAGNNAPSYYGLMWECMKNNDLGKLPIEYMTKVVTRLRQSGTHRSSAEVIEGVRLAKTLAALHHASSPNLKDLRDAAVICLGYGQLSVVAEALAHVDIGTHIGSLPEGVSRTSIQDDFYRTLRVLNLEKYKTTVAAELDLDLRENRRVKSEEAAFLDLNRSFFLHRIKVLNISFQQLKPGSQKSSTWSESWVLRWTPEAEIELVESTLRGETIELACAYVFKERLENSQSISEAGQIIREACECGMMESMEEGRIALQRLAVDSGSFHEISSAAYDLATVISYKDIRRFDTDHLIPLLTQLFLRGTLLLTDAAKCDNNAARAMVEWMHRFNLVALEHYQIVDEALWVKKLTELFDADDRNPLLSGYACAILLERNMIDGGKLSEEVSRRLSPGIEADLGAGWFEGLSMRNRYSLLARMELWEQLSLYVESLDDEEFKRALVFLRRAFGDFGPIEKRSICENLSEIWGIYPDEASDVLSRELDEEEQRNLEDLNNFDFGDI